MNTINPNTYSIVYDTTAAAPSAANCIYFPAVGGNYYYPYTYTNYAYDYEARERLRKLEEQVCRLVVVVEQLALVVGNALDTAE